MKTKKNPFEIHRIGHRLSGIPLWRDQPWKRHARKKKNTLILKYVGLFALTLILTLLVYFKEQTGDWFKASVLQTPDPFDGTVLPVEKVPNWVKWKGDHVTSNFRAIPEDMLISLPAYDLSLMGFPEEKLEWGNPAHDIIYNTKITYSVVYLGNYELDHREEVGSHLAVDIKMPQGTPVRAIANGKVVKMTMAESGFGHHLVIKHIDAPDPENPGQKAVFYSAYNHLNDILVSEGQNVKKGEVVASSGNTGTSTTPHLHFQIDREGAPWHPYWPFSSAESQAAGLSFFEAINAGLGLSKAKELTINPMTFVTQNLGDYSALVASNGSTEVIPLETVTSEPPQVIPENPPTTEVIPEAAVVTDERDPSLLTFKLMGEGVSLLDSGLRIMVKDEYDSLSKLKDDDVIPVKIEGVGEVTPTSLKKSNFENGMAGIAAKSLMPGLGNVTVGKSSHQITFIEKVKNAVALKIEHDGYFQKGREEKVKVVAVDENGQPSPSLSFSGEVAITTKEGEAVINPNRLSAQDFQNGVATIQIKVLSNEPLTLRAQNGALVGESEAMRPEEASLFSDVTSDHAHFAGIKFLKEESILSGYPDGSFKPEKTVNRVEALKMLMLAFGVEAGPAANPLPFKDTDNSAWYAGTLAAALEKGIVQGYPDGTFHPDQTVNRAEYLKILFNSAGTEAVATLGGRPYDDVDPESWFAGYAYLANKKNILDIVDNLLHPTTGMTRAEVAETIYRMKMIKKNGLVSYSR